MAAKKGSVERVRQALREFGLSGDIIEFAHSTRTAEEAALAVGCDVGQIVKSLLFRAHDSGRAVLVLTSGSNRVDVTQLGAHIGETLDKADAAFVREHTGFAIGGVAPIGHLGEVLTLVDASLLHYSDLWAAAGSPYTVFRLTPEQLVQMSGGQVVTVL